MAYFIHLVILLVCQCVCKDITIGYITGSEKKDPTQFYDRPGQAISGALTLALDEINNDSTILPNHTLTYIISETYGDELYSIRKTVKLINANISAYIGPQETCIHEAKLAAAFNIPMISYVSTTT